jgi:transposase-like protein
MGRTRKYKRYNPEFKREALKRASEDGMTDKFVCEELGISSRQLGRWRDELRLLGNDAFVGKGGHSTAEEMIRLKRELAKVKQERDFLKDAVVFFAKESE